MTMVMVPAIANFIEMKAKNETSKPNQINTKKKKRQKPQTLPFLVIFSFGDSRIIEMKTGIEFHDKESHCGRYDVQFQ